MQLSERVCRVRLLALDVDGVLTDGSLYYGPGGEEIKVFNVKDGMGVTLARRGGLEVAIITGRSTRALELRARDLKIRHLYMGCSDKVAALREISEELKLQPSEIAFIGDDLNDLPAFRYVGMAVAVADAVSEMKEQAHYVTNAAGGRGAVREVVELILKQQDRWETVISSIQGNSAQ